MEKQQQLLHQLDVLLKASRLDEAEKFFDEQIPLAEQAGDLQTALTLYNEQIGFFRDCCRFSEALAIGEKALQCVERLKLSQTIAHATTLLNVANAQRAAGEASSALESYRLVKNMYDQLLAPDDDRVASYYNNLSLLYQSMDRWEASCDALKKALEIVSAKAGQEQRVAISQTNLAVSLLHLHRESEALPLIEAALDFFTGLSPSDFHYSAALAAMGDAQYQLHDYEKSVWYYEVALSEIALHMGTGENYQIVQENAKRAYEKLGGKPEQNGMTLCRKYYEAFGKPMLKRMFPDVLNRLTIGLAGEGSECFGYDDALSQDHDFGPGFCIWVPNDFTDSQIAALQQAYDLLPKTYCGVTRMTTPQGTNRVGVCRTSDFYRRLLGTDGVPQTEQQWLDIDETQLAAAVNGELFQEADEEFLKIRKVLQQGYPEPVRLRRLAQETALMAQYGQYNLSRLLQRKDLFTARLAFYHFAESSMYALHLCERTYAPYYKWLPRSAASLPHGIEIVECLKKSETLPIEEWESEIVAPVCAEIAKRMRMQKLSEQEESYMQIHAEAAAKKAEMMEQKEALVERIAKLEFSEFDKVKNEGVRAGCQDDWETFSIMRESQYQTWELPMLEQYFAELQNAAKRGWNLLTEKYARMMQSTAPEEYAALEKQLPEIPEQKAALCEAIVAIQVGWMEEFAQKYPKLAGQARPIHSSEDSGWNTSYETYLRGELLTYSEELLQLYGTWIVKLYKNGANLAEKIMTNTVHRYGYASLEEA